MTTSLAWTNVIDRLNDKPEFGACHVNCAWRRHKGAKFSSLENAFDSSGNSIRRLLQSVGGNVNAKNYKERGSALFAAVWYHDSPWAVLCDPTHAVLVGDQDIAYIEECAERDDSIAEYLRQLIERSPVDLRRPLDAVFYTNNIAPNRD
jgi:hypothetical protein